MLKKILDDCNRTTGIKITKELKDAEKHCSETANHCLLRVIMIKALIFYLAQIQRTPP